VSEDTAPQALLDTSVFVAAEQGRPLRALPDRAAISVVTLAELRLGVMLARSPEVHAQRLRTFSRVERLFEPLPVTVEVASAFADIVADARQKRRRPRLMDVWIAATAVAHGIPVCTQDSDFDDLAGVTVLRV